MGWSVRWLRRLLRRKKERDNLNSGDCRREKKGWGLDKSGRAATGNGNAGRTPASKAGEEAWLGQYYAEREKEQSRHAIAVAAATAAAADAAVAAAQAAVAVVRLTSRGRDSMFSGGREWWAATTIQAAFRGYLAKRALRALRGLVKLQAHFRGYLVRKRAAETLQSMQSLIRAQATVQMQKVRLVQNEDHRHHFDIWPRKSIERFDDMASKRISYVHSRRLSGSFEIANINTFDESPKTVEIDTCRTNSKSGRSNASISDSGDQRLLLETLASPVPCRVSAQLSTANRGNLCNTDQVLMDEECCATTAQSTPRFTNSGGTNTGMPTTPAKSVCGDNYYFRQYSNYPNYMANTQSFRAKVRSQSAPKQRPLQSPKKGFSLNEMEYGACVSGDQMRRSCSQLHEAFNFRNAAVGRIDKSNEFEKEAQKCCLQRSR